MISRNEIKDGSIVLVRGEWGAGTPKTVTVEKVHDDSVNKYSFITYKDGENGHWAHLDQIDKVVSY